VTLIHDETIALVLEGLPRVHVEVEELYVDNIPRVARLENGGSIGSPSLRIT
jgi:hypothetical protein